MGINSLTLTQISSVLQKSYSEQITIADFYANPTIRDLARYIKYGSSLSEKREDHMKKSAASQNEDVAIVGISLKVANAAGIDEYWDLIRSGSEAVRSYLRKGRKTFMSIL